MVEKKSLIPTMSRAPRALVHVPHPLRSRPPATVQSEGGAGRGPQTGRVTRGPSRRTRRTNIDGQILLDGKY